MWHLRIHCISYTPQELYQYLNTICIVVLCVFEQHDNRPHIHMLFEEGALTKSTINQKLVKQFPLLKGNGCYSFSDAEKVVKKKSLGDEDGRSVEKALAYLCKGASVDEMPNVIGQTKVDVEKYHNDYWLLFLELKTKGKVNTGCQNDSLPKVKSKTWTERVYDEITKIYVCECQAIVNYQLLYKPTDFEKADYDKSRMIIFRYMMKCFGKAVKKISEKIIVEIWDGFMNAIVQNSGNAEAADKYSDKLFNSIIVK